MYDEELYIILINQLHSYLLNQYLIEEMSSVQTSAQDLNFAFVWNSYVTHIPMMSKSCKCVSVCVYLFLVRRRFETC